MDYLKSFSDDQLIDQLFKYQIGKYSTEDINKLHLITKKYLMKDCSSTELAKSIEKISLDIKKDSVKISRTFVVAYRRIQYLQKALISGIGWFQYTGPPPTGNCIFCSDILGNHYNFNAIIKMKNGVFEPVIFFGGGFECPHIWEPDPFYKTK